MKMYHYVFLLLFGALMYACASGSEDGTKQDDMKETESLEKEEASEKDDDENKGIGEVKNVELNEPLEMSMVKDGKAIYEMKCASCHKLTGQRVVGPGWEGITDRRTPEWIMNMITNVEIMLAEDPEAQKLLEECLTRMPDQNVSVGDARDILEFMYYNDGKHIPEGAEEI